MDKIVKFVILACLLLSCEEYEIPKHCFKMNISNALPVQFWVNGEETFNQKDICGITPVCFCQPFQCDDEIKIQFTSVDDIDYYLNIFDSNNNELAMVIFESNLVSGLYVYEYTFTPNDLSICDLQIKMFIVTVNNVGFESIPGSLLSSGFDTDIDGWTQQNEATITDNWFWDDGIGESAGPYLGGVSRLHQTQSSEAQIKHTIPDVNVGDTVRIRTRFSCATTLFGDCSMKIYFLHASFPIPSLIATFTQGSSDTEVIIDYTFVAPPSILIEIPYSTIMFTIEGGENDGNKVSVDYFELSTPGSSIIIFDGLEINEIFAKSDCLSIRESHPCTLLINYSNNSNVFGLRYEDESPSPNFNLRIPAIFFDEQNIEEQEDHETSENVIIRLYNKIEEKRNLQIGHMPHYMHRKTTMALSHDFVIIDGKDWIKRDEYKKNEGDRHYPLKSAQVLLTDKSFIKENQL